MIRQLTQPRMGLIWAEAQGGVIGYQGGMPWHVPEDLAHFSQITMGSAVVMGRKTWDSLPERFRPLPGRENLVLTRDLQWSATGATRAESLNQVLAQYAKVWVIGGSEIFRIAMAEADRIEITELDLAVPGDTFSPRNDPEQFAAEGWILVSSQPWETSKTGVRYRFLQYERPTDCAG